MSSGKTKNLLDIVPIYSPRTTYSQIKANDDKMISDITLNFDKTTIGLLRQEFDKRNGELTLNQFIVLAKKHLKFWQPDFPDRQKCLVRFLTQLFNQIDINGNGDMEWKEFTNYIIEKAIVLKNLKSKSEEIKRYVKSNIEPKIKIDGIIQKGEYIKDINKMAFFEQGSGKIHFVDINDGTSMVKPLEIDPKKLVINISSIKKTRDGKVQIRKKDLEIPTEVRVLDILYLAQNKYKILLVSTSDGYVRGWKHVQNGFVLATQPDNQQEIFEHFFNSQIYSLAWDNVNQVLYCGQKSGSIYMWNLKTDLEKALEECKPTQEDKDSNEKKINQMITYMITMPKLQFMASGRMDGKLILWDTINNKKKWIYKQHTRGILSLAFNESMILLFSAGFDHKICVWNPYIETLIHKIEIHLAPILTLRVIESSNQLISMDSDGVVKITDTKRFHGIYSFSIEKNENTHLVNPGSNGFNLSGFIAIDKPIKLIFIGKSLSIYEYDKNYNPYAADQNFVVAIAYIEQTTSFITASGNKIKVWSALNGDITKIFVDVSQHEITAMVLDSLKKRMIIGDHDGNVSVHNVLNGAKMKHLAKHKSQILSLLTMKNDSETLVSCSIDNQIRIFKGVDDNFEIVRFIYFSKMQIQITNLQYEPNIKLLMLGTNVGTVGFYDTETGKNVGNCLNKNQQEITSLCATKQSIMISTSSTGKVYLFGIPPANNKFEKILSFLHRDCQKMGNIGLGITTSCYDDEKNLLFVVDDKMYLSCYDLSQISAYKQGFKKANNNTEVISKLQKALQKLKFKINWQVKSNHEIIKLIQFVKEENIIITCSYDKKVKLWNAQNGEYIDSLQQNYNKSIPEPIAFYDTRKHILIAKNRRQTLDYVKIDLPALQTDPSKLEEFIQNYDSLKRQKSNKDWNFNVKMCTKNFPCKFDESQFNQTKTKTIEQANLEEGNSDFKKKILNSKTARSLGKLRRQCISKIKDDIAKCQKVLNKENSMSFYQGMSTHQGFGSQFSSSSQTPVPEAAEIVQTFQNQQNFFGKKQKKAHIKRSMMKCIQNCLEMKKHDELLCNFDKEKQLIKQTIKKSRDYVPIYQVLGLKPKKKAVDEHKRLIDQLYRTETKSILNSRQEKGIYMGGQEAKATQKICELLLKIDDTDKRPKSLMKNTKIKQVSQSMHSTLAKGFPKI